MVTGAGWPEPGDDAPRRRVILLGASNLTRGISMVVEAATSLWGQPLEIFTAMGHGRSYGQVSWALGRSLPGIRQCGLWEEVARRRPLPTTALLTDIGNDVAYGATIEQIVDWLDECLYRLEQLGAKVTVTGLPLESLERISLFRFYLAKTLFFPRQRLTRRRALELAADLDRRVLELSQQRRLAHVAARREWYGWDPIHIRRTRQAAAWSEIVSAWQPEAARQKPRGSLSRWCYLQSRRPQQMRLLGMARQFRQPAGRLPDGTTISLY